MLDFKYSADPNAREPLVNNSGRRPYFHEAVPSLRRVIDGGFAGGQRAAGGRRRAGALSLPLPLARR